MNPNQIALVQSSFEQAARIAPHFAATFYAELFALDPSLRGLFKNDMIAQGQKLMQTLAVIVSSLDQGEAPEARELAIRHLEYGVTRAHYRLVELALMRTLKHELGPSFTPEAREAWAAAYAELSKTMIEAAYPPAA